jgi:hypothetical protein
MSDIGNRPHDTDTALLRSYWLAACEQLRATYQWWSEAGADCRPGYYAAVVAMIDQEEAAAAVYAQAVRRRTERLDSEPMREFPPAFAPGEARTAVAGADTVLVNSDFPDHHAR